MTGFKDEDSTYKGYDIETLQENQWVCRIYKDGTLLHTVKEQRKKKAYHSAKTWIDKKLAWEDYEAERFWRGR